MRWSYDERGDVDPTSVRMTPREAKKWIWRSDRQIPSHLLPEVRRHREARDRAAALAELDARFPERKKRGPGKLWQEMQARQPQIGGH